MRVSVCVPTFERPATTGILIESFLAQDYGDRELIIADDSASESIKHLVAAYSDDRLRYIRHGRTVGFHENLRRALAQCSGDVIVIMGDDDVLARVDALSVYAEAFSANQTVGFASANLVQIDACGKVTFAYKKTEHNLVFDKGTESLEHLLLSSVHIAGIAFRRLPELLDFYPAHPMLFPQVYLAAGVLTNHSGMLIGQYLSAARMHEQQLGFKAMKRVRRNHDEKADCPPGIDGRSSSGPIQGSHGNVEISQVIARLRDQSILQPRAVRGIERQYMKSYATNMVNEKITSGNIVMWRNLQFLRKYNTAASDAYWLVLLAAGVVMAPRRLAKRLKLLVRGLVANRIFRDYEDDREWPLLKSLQHDVLDSSP